MSQPFLFAPNHSDSAPPTCTARLPPATPQKHSSIKDPTKHFPPQRDGDLVKDGVCGLLIAQKLRVSQPTASDHLNLLVQAGLLRPKRIKWTFYRRDETAIRAVKRAIAANL